MADVEPAASSAAAAGQDAVDGSASSAAAQPAEAASVVAEASAPAQDTAHEAPSNVVALSPSRLTDRLAQVSPLGADPAGDAAPAADAAAALIAPAPSGRVPGQAHVAAALKAALSAKRVQHVLVLGDTGTGRLDAVMQAASEVFAGAAPAPDLVYAHDPADAVQLKGYQVPAGEGAALARDCNAAVARASATLARLYADEDYKLAADLLAEERRERTDAAVAALRRRAEAQNIAVVKSLDGFVLAPMHDGRVVRADVFRALPETLQREVESKIASLESELQALVATQPQAEIEMADKFEALARETAQRALRPQLAVVKQLHAAVTGIAEILINSEQDFLARAAAHPGRAPEGYTALLHAAGPAPAAPIIFARNTSPRELCGEIGRTATGALAARSGVLNRANGGVLIVDAWRLVQNPSGWLALAAALETSQVAPAAADGLVVQAAACPLAVRLVLIADAASWAKVKAIDPGAAQLFASAVELAGAMAKSEVSCADFAAFAARLAKGAGLRALHADAGAALYEDAVARGGGDAVALDRVALLRLLEAADARAAHEGAEHVRQADVAFALANRPASAAL